MVPRTSDGRVLFVIPWHGHAVAGTTDTPLDAPSLEPRALDEEIEFILETAGRYLTRPPTRADVLAVYVGLRPLVKGDGKNLGALARSRHPRGYLGPAHHHRRQVDHLSAHGRGLRRSRHHLGRLRDEPCPTRNLRIHGYLETRKRRCRRAAARSTAPMRRRSARWRSDSGLAAQLHPALAVHCS